MPFEVHGNSGLYMVKNTFMLNSKICLSLKSFLTVSLLASGTLNSLFLWESLRQYLEMHWKKWVGSPVRYWKLHVGYWLLPIRIFLSNLAPYLHQSKEPIFFFSWIRIFHYLYPIFTSNISDRIQGKWNVKQMTQILKTKMMKDWVGYMKYMNSLTFCKSKSFISFFTPFGLFLCPLRNSWLIFCGFKFRIESCLTEHHYAACWDVY